MFITLQQRNNGRAGAVREMGENWKKEKDFLIYFLSQKAGGGFELHVDDVCEGGNGNLITNKIFFSSAAVSFMLN